MLRLTRWLFRRLTAAPFGELCGGEGGGNGHFTLPQALRSAPLRRMPAKKAGGMPHPLAHSPPLPTPPHNRHRRNCWDVSPLPLSLALRLKQIRKHTTLCVHKPSLTPPATHHPPVDHIPHTRTPASHHPHPPPFTHPPPHPSHHSPPRMHSQIRSSCQTLPIPHPRSPPSTTAYRSPCNTQQPPSPTPHPAPCVMSCSTACAPT